MIDWGLAQRLGALVAGSSTSPPLRLDGLAAEVAEGERLVAEYTGLRASAPIPVAEAVDRAGWIQANIVGLRHVMDPVVERVGGRAGALQPAAKATASILLAAEIGVLFGLLGRRVLGQYELELLRPQRAPRLLFVAPNLADATKSFDADPEELVRWVALHEVTHALQFGGVPWLRPHLAGLLGELLRTMTVKVDAARAGRLPALADLRALVEAVRRGDILTAVIGPEQRRTLDQVQATMAVLEGHAEHVMDAVGASVLPSLPKLRSALGRRRTSQPPLARLLSRLLGFDLKMRQYDLGKRFCDGVVAHAGLPALNRVWGHPELLPSLEELEDPVAWVARTEPLRLAG